MKKIIICQFDLESNWSFLFPFFKFLLCECSLALPAGIISANQITCCFQTTVVFFKNERSKNWKLKIPQTFFSSHPFLSLQMCPSASPECEASSAGSLPAGGLHRWRLSAGRGGAEVVPRLPQDHRGAPGQPSRVSPSLAAAHLLGTQAEQGHHQTFHR